MTKATRKISVTRALVELKTLGDRINRAIAQGTFVSTVVGHGNQRKSLDFPSVVDLENKIKGSFDSVNALIFEREKIKSAIVLSNANTMVQLMNRTMTVAEAIELKATVDFRNTYLNTLRSQLTNSRNRATVDNAKLETKIETLLTTLYGSEKTKVDQASVAAVSDPQRNQHEVTLFDPCSISAKIEQLQNEVEVLTSEIDFVLSESNAKTEIEV